MNCTTTCFVQINDSSVSVKSPITITDTSSLIKYYDNSLISNLTVNYEENYISYTMQNIDSLGRYLYPSVPNNFIKFTLRNDTLYIKNDDLNAFYNKNDFCCHLNLEITTEQKIKSILNSDSKEKVKNSNKVIISKSRKKMTNKIHPLDIIVVFYNN